LISADTNLFVYASDRRDPLRREMADVVVERLGRLDTAIGLQVIGELQNALRRRLRVEAPTAFAVAEALLSRFPTFAYDERAAATALTEARAGRLSYWDALLLAAADAAGIRVMLSEDMADGLVFGGVEVINPFGLSGVSDRARELLGIAP
jgi:predicted nucleic acid-binding protein